MIVSLTFLRQLLHQKKENKMYSTITTSTSLRPELSCGKGYKIFKHS